MLFLLAVLAVALRYGRGPAALASFLNVAAFDFFFVPPKLSFSVSDVQYVLTFGVMLAVGLIVGQLTAGLRFQARIAQHRERRSQALFEVARDLSSMLATEQVVETAATAVAREFRAQAHFFVLDANDHLGAVKPAPEDAGLDAGTARWAFDHALAAGLGTDTLPGSAWLYIPLKAPMRTRGVLALKAEEPRLLLVPEQRRQLETFAALTAIALERVHYVEVAQQATVQIESERLRNSLLAALSHDLRTPLAGLVGLADTLRLTQPPLAAKQAEIAQALQTEALRLNTQVNNLLDMARIESGSVRLQARMAFDRGDRRQRPARDRARARAAGRRHRPAGRPAAGRMRCGADRAGVRQPARERREVHAADVERANLGPQPRAARCGSRSPTTGRASAPVRRRRSSRSSPAARASRRSAASASA